MLRRTIQGSMMKETHGLVYTALHNSLFAERVNLAWRAQLHSQKLAMRKALSFMLTPCVEHIMSFLELDDELVHVCLLLRQRRSELGTPTIQSRVVSFLDIRFGVRRAFRAIVLQYFWNNYVGRPSDFKGSTMHWTRVCQEIADYQFAHSRCSASSGPRCLRDKGRVSRFREQLDNLSYKKTNSAE